MCRCLLIFLVWVSFIHGIISIIYFVSNGIWKERKNKKVLSIRLSQFFDHYLKGEKAPLWMTEGIPATEDGKTLK